MAWRYICEVCGREESIESPLWRCPEDGGPFLLDGPNDYATATINRDDATFRRYSDLLPVDHSTFESLGGGMTPLVEGRLAERAVWFKLDSLLPTGSFKDRGAATFAGHLRRIGVDKIAHDSSGNAAAAMAGYSAAAGLDCTVYAPASASPDKLVQARAYGATVIPVEGSREDVARAAQDAADSDDSVFYASHNWSPIFAEGVKTWALEVWVQLGNRMPVATFVPTGGGSALIGAWRGFSALDGTMPALVAVQPAACAPIVSAFREGKDAAEPVSPGTTIAEGTRIGAPVRDRQILTALRESGGRSEAIKEDDLIETLKELWGQGFYVEPTAALGAAAFRRTALSGADLPDGPIVVLLTGSGLKATASIGKILG